MATVSREQEAGAGLPRLLDVVLASVGLAAAAPFLLAAAIAIKLDSRGPAIYRQTRVGKDGELFEVVERDVAVEPGRRRWVRARAEG